MKATFKIAVIDYGLGNLRSVVRGMEAGGCSPVITADPELIASANMKVPQMGWNTISLSSHPLFAEIPDGTYVYFVHSYYADTTPAFTIAATEYVVPYASAVASGNALGVQFHPEKKRACGLAILRNFVAMTE